MIKLTDKQKEIVNSKNQYISIVAGAGSGKTRVVTMKIIEAIKSLKEGQKILGITFSNKATEELSDRLITSIGDEEVSRYTYIGTIHNLCNEILMTHGHLIGISNKIMICSNNDDRMQIFKQSIESVPSLYNELMKNKENKKRQQTVNDWLDFISKQKRNLKFASDYDPNKTTYMLMKEFDDRLLNQGMIDFDDIIRYAYKILVNFPAVLRVYQRIYKELYVDEAQDINLAQYEIIKLIAGDQNKIIMVGDPNQAIYGFSGGSPKFLKTKFSEDFNVTTFNLNENFRSAKSIIEASNKLEKSFQAQAIYPILGEFIINDYDDEVAEAQAIVSKIESLMKNGHQDLEAEVLKTEDCAIIARNRYIFKYVIEELDKKDIKYSLKVSPRGSFSSESDLMRVFELGLILIGNKLNLINLNELNEILGTEKIKDFFEINTSIELSEALKRKYGYVVEAVALIKEDEDVNLKKMLDQVSNILNDNQVVLDINEKKLIQEDINFWHLNWNNYVKSSSLGDRNYSNFIRRISLVTTTMEAKEALTLTTVHMSKGLEYEVVFVMGLNDGVFPDYRSVQALSAGNQDSMREEKHNLFVAVTRAKRLCYLSYPKKRVMPWGETMNQKPSRFLKDFSSN